jgi:alkylation response protein AidB-like acyl-CoA dehydrogenase
MTDVQVHPDTVREEVRSWLAEHATPGKNRQQFVEEVVDAGWALPTFPHELYGRGLPASADDVVVEEFTAAGVPLPYAFPIAAHVIRTHGETHELKGILRELLLGATCCLLYSEPGAGSDLASLQTRADRDGDAWIVNGQKVWTSGAASATFGLLAARTDWDVPKHKGISFFVCPMNQPGVEVRPIKQINRGLHFNEVFLTDARVPDAFRAGKINDGWRVMQTALAVERMMMGDGNSLKRWMLAEVGLERTVSADADMASGLGPVDLVTTARAKGRNGDGAVRQAIARMHSLRRIQRWNGQRAAGMTDMRLAAILKLAQSEILHGSARIHAMLLGPEALLWEDSSSAGEQVNQNALGAFVNSIGGGSDQIQRNIIGERVLGLPRDPAVDLDVPFKDVRKAEAFRRLG